MSMSSFSVPRALHTPHYFILMIILHYRLFHLHQRNGIQRIQVILSRLIQLGSCREPEFEGWSDFQVPFFPHALGLCPSQSNIHMGISNPFFLIGQFTEPAVPLGKVGNRQRNSVTRRNCILCPLHLMETFSYFVPPQGSVFTFRG